MPISHHSLQDSPNTLGQCHTSVLAALDAQGSEAVRNASWLTFRIPGNRASSSRCSVFTSGHHGPPELDTDKKRVHHLAMLRMLHMAAGKMHWSASHCTRNLKTRTRLVSVGKAATRWSNASYHAFRRGETLEREVWKPGDVEEWEAVCATTKPQNHTSPNFGSEVRCQARVFWWCSARMLLCVVARALRCHDVTRVRHRAVARTVCRTPGKAPSSTDARESSIQATHFALQHHTQRRFTAHAHAYVQPSTASQSPQAATQPVFDRVKRCPARKTRQSRYQSSDRRR